MRVKRPGETHWRTTLCRQLTNLQARRRQCADHQSARIDRLSVGDTELDQVDEFCYLGRPLTSSDCDYAALQQNLRKARLRWARICQVLARHRVPPRVAGYFYKATCQSVLFYGAETWVPDTRILSTLESFHHRIARCLTKRHIRQRSVPGQDVPIWICPDTATTLDEAGLFPISHYLESRAKSLVRYAYTESQWLPHARLATGPSSRRKYWWDHYPPTNADIAPQ